MRQSQKSNLALFSFVLLFFLLCDPLWFNVLIFTTKEHQGFHKGLKGLLIQPPTSDYAANAGACPGTKQKRPSFL